jgi:hypothetical protein
VPFSSAQFTHLSCFDKLCSFEILHCRWAMLAALGVVVPEVLDLFGLVHFVEPVWWKVGYAKLQVKHQYSVSDLVLA